MAIPWSPGKPTRTPEPTDLAAADRHAKLLSLGVSAGVLAAAAVPGRGIFAPDPARATPIEREYSGYALFATSEWQDEFLIVGADGSCRRIHVEDGELARFDSLPLMLAELVITAWEAELGDAATTAMARDLGVRDPKGLVAALRASSRPTFEADRAWRTTELPRFL